MTKVDKSPVWASRSRLGVQVIARAADILRVLEGDHHGLSLGQIAKKLGLPRSTVQRIVAALDAENLVMSASPSGRVCLGPELARLARSVRFPIVEMARPYLLDLSRVTGETVDLATLHRENAVFVDQIQGLHRLRAVSGVGISFPLHCTANGKAMLAALDDNSLQKLKRYHRLVRFTKNTVCSWSELEDQLAEVRKTGIAFDREEHSIGISAIGAAVVGFDGETAAVSIPTPTVRFVEKEAELIAALQECTLALSRVVGGQGDSRQK